MTFREYITEMLDSDSVEIIEQAKALHEDDSVPTYEDVADSREDIIAMLNSLDLCAETVEFVRLVLLATMQENDGIGINYNA